MDKDGKSTIKIHNFHIVFKFMDFFRSVETNHFIHLFLPIHFLKLEFTLQTVIVVRSDKPWTNFMVKSNVMCAKYGWNMNASRKHPFPCKGTIYLQCNRTLSGDQFTYYVQNMSLGLHFDFQGFKKMIIP